jgi:hypothetical protein
MDHYQKVQNEYGLPLDSRSTYTKLDWILWTATLTQNRDDFMTLVKPVYRFLEATPDKSPMTDWYHTHDAKKVGFTARPVVGGVFMQLLYSPELWQKWSKYGQELAGNYAPLPTPPKITAALPAADSQAAKWRYTTDQPAGSWSDEQFDDSAWSEGPSGFGTPQTPGAVVGTLWNTNDIWMRRDFDLPELPAGELLLYIHNDEDAKILINGVVAAEISGHSNGYFRFPISPAAAKTLRPTGNVLAVHCHQTWGGQYIDVGLIAIEGDTQIK